MFRHLTSTGCGAAVALAVLLMGGVLHAQPGQLPPGIHQQGAVQPPQTLPPELEAILKKWETHSVAMSKVHGSFERIERDKLFQIEKRAVGEYWYEMPDKGKMEFRPDTRIPAPPENQSMVEGVLYTIQPDLEKTWVCTGKDIFDIDVPNKKYNQIEIPPQFQGNRISDGPLPFLFGIKAEKAKQRYLLSLGDMHMQAPSNWIHIIAHPLLPDERREFQRAEVLLNSQTFMPYAVKLLDPSDNKQTIYIFKEHKKVTLWGLTGAPWNVNLTRYERMHLQKASPDDAPRKDAERSGGITIR